MKPFLNDDEPSVDFPIYTRGNIGEAFPDVISPLTGSLMMRPSARGQARWALRTGLLSKRHVVDPRNSMSMQFQGYLYANASMARLGAVRAPGVKISDIDAQNGGFDVLPPYEPAPGDRNLRESLRLALFALGLMRDHDSQRAREAQRDVDRWIVTLPAPVDATDSDLLSRVRKTSHLFETLLFEMMTVSMHAAASRVAIERLCEQAGCPELANAITSGLGGVASAEPAVALWRLGREVNDTPVVAAHFDVGPAGLLDRLRNDSRCNPFVERFGATLDDFGFHGPNELELAAPKWGSDPQLALDIIDRLRHAPDTRNPIEAAHRLEDTRETACSQVRSKLSRPARWLFDKMLRSAQLYIPEREATKASLVRGLFQARVAVIELARRHQVEPDDVYLVTNDELERFLAHPDSFAAVIAERRSAVAYLNERQPPFWFAGKIPDPTTWALRSAAREPATGEIRGMGVSSGVVSGRACVVLDPTDATELQPDDILVAPQTDPAWTPLFLAAAGVVVDIGAQMSHAAIIARELGIPAVVAAEGATTAITDGTIITIDGTTGTVTIG